ncbi:MAG: hypothetical protein ABJA35_10535 [Parafilimonas sp.]
MIVFLTLPLTHNLFTTSQQSCTTDKCGDMCPLKSKQKQSDKNACNSGSCNPFVNCPLCQYTAIESFTLSNMIVSLNTVHVIKNENAVFSYNKACWHPPEMI